MARATSSRPRSGTRNTPGTASGANSQQRTAGREARTMLLNRKEDILHFTRSYTGERFPNGRPRVSDDILQRMKLVTVEEAWGVCKSHGYTHQYEGGWWNVH